MDDHVREIQPETYHVAENCPWRQRAAAGGLYVDLEWRPISDALIRWGGGIRPSKEYLPCIQAARGRFPKTL